MENKKMKSYSKLSEKERIQLAREEFKLVRDGIESWNHYGYFVSDTNTFGRAKYMKQQKVDQKGINLKYPRDINREPDAIRLVYLNEPHLEIVKDFYGLFYMWEEKPSAMKQYATYLSLLESVGYENFRNACFEIYGKRLYYPEYPDSILFKKGRNGNVRVDYVLKPAVETVEDLSLNFTCDIPYSDAKWLFQEAKIAKRIEAEPLMNLLKLPEEKKVLIKKNLGLVSKL